MNENIPVPENTINEIVFKLKSVGIHSGLAPKNLTKLELERTKAYIYDIIKSEQDELTTLDDELHFCGGFDNVENYLVKIKMDFKYTRDSEIKQDLANEIEYLEGVLQTYNPEQNQKRIDTLLEIITIINNSIKS